jgi:hypothetical protein
VVRLSAIDLASRGLIGITTGARHVTVLVVAGLIRVSAPGRPVPGAYLHVVRYRTFAIHEYLAGLMARGLTASGDRDKNSWKNAVAESCSSILRWELLAHRDFAKRVTVAREFAHFLRTL